MEEVFLLCVQVLVINSIFSYICSMRKNYEQDYLKAKKYFIDTGESLTKVSEKFNIHRGNFTRRLKEEGFIIENKQNRVRFDNTVFDEIDTEEKAYWLGFIFADGYVSDENHFELSLGAKDFSHLQKFGRFLNYESNVKLYGDRCRFVINNKHFTQALKKLGCIPRKSLVLEFPKRLRKDLISHFIRGYSDGDGCLYHIQPKKSLSLSFHLLGTEKFLSVCLTHFKLEHKKIYSYPNKGGVCSIQMSFKQALDVCSYMYKDANILLERKYEKYNKIAVLRRNS